MDPVVVGVVIFVIGLIISIMKTVVGIKNDKNTESMLQIIKKGTNHNFHKYKKSNCCHQKKKLLESLWN